MTKDEVKNRISMALKDPVLQQGFEIICKENSELEKRNEQLTNAKELLKWFVWYFREGNSNLVPYKHKVKEAEQFLNSKGENERMTDEELEVVIFNDKSWIRFSEYMELKTENKELKNDIKKMKKKITDFIYDITDFIYNDEDCLDKIIKLLGDWGVDK